LYKNDNGCPECLVSGILKIFAALRGSFRKTVTKMKKEREKTAKWDVNELSVCGLGLFGVVILHSSSGKPCKESGFGQIGAG
jgi:hypothetical protein